MVLTLNDTALLTYERESNRLENDVSTTQWASASIVLALHLTLQYSDVIRMLHECICMNKAVPLKVCTGIYGICYMPKYNSQDPINGSRHQFYTGDHNSVPAWKRSNTPGLIFKIDWNTEKKILELWKKWPSYWKYHLSSFYI